MNQEAAQEKEVESFTLAEMRQAYRKYVRGEPLTEKELVLAEAKSLAIRACMPDQ